MAELYIYDVCWFNIYLFWRTKTLVIWYIDLELLWLMPTGNVLWNCLWGFFQSRSDCYKTKWTNTFYPHILWTNAIFFSFFGQVCNCLPFLISHCSHCLVCANAIQQFTCKTINFSSCINFEIHIQFTTSSRRLDGGANCGAPVGGKCLVSKAKLVLYAFAV